MKKPAFKDPLVMTTYKWMDRDLLEHKVERFFQYFLWAERDVFDHFID